jgi:hypothetical protein
LTRDARLLVEARTPHRAPRRRLPRTRVRLLALGALTAAIVIGTTIAQNIGGHDEKGHPRPVIPGPVANTDEVLNRGVTLGTDMVNVGDRKAVTVALVQDYMYVEILIDAETHRYLGERIIAIKDHTNRALDGTTTTKKGALLSLRVRTGYGIVDKPGQTP